MAILDAVLAPLEIALNKALTASPAALQQLAGEQQSLALYFRDLAWGFRLQPTVHGLQLQAGLGESRAAISTSLVGLARLLAGEDPRAMGDALVLEGDAEYAERLLGALRHARFDLEAELGALLEPLGAAGLGRGLRNWAERGRRGLAGLLLGEVQRGPESGGGLANGEEVRRWMDEVDDLAVSLDRLEARVLRSEQGSSQA